MKHPRRYSPWFRMVFVFGLVGAGCSASDPENGKVRCEPSTHACPSGYYCALELNTCWRNGTDASLPPTGSNPDGGSAVGRDGGVDVPAAGGAPDAATSEVGNIADGRAAEGTDGGAPDAPIPGTGSGADGVNCSAGSDCQSGSCVDGVCCKGACSDACYACNMAMTGKADGTCAPVALGKKDPRNICADETSTNECGKDGLCDGAGACHNVEPSHVCTKATCTTAGFVAAATCDAKGACNKQPAATDCGAATCDPVDGCQTSCQSDSNCATGSYCNTTAKKCAAKKTIGTACGANGECTSEACVDGVCCKTECSGSCYACNVSGFEGTCSPVPSGTADPRNVCAVSGTTCGTNGKCDGTGGCYVAPKGTTGSDCGTSCSGSTVSTKSCEAGNCVGTSVACSNNLKCDDKGVSCKTSCTGNSDCADGTLCTSGRCATICTYDESNYASDSSDDPNACVYGP